jgi:glycerol uptake facilitator-like aquaporin
MAFVLTLAQSVGAVLGYGLLQFLTPEQIFSIPEHGTCVTRLHPLVSVTQGFFVEFVLTSALICMICGVWDPRNRSNGDSAPLRIGKLLI